MRVSLALAVGSIAIFFATENALGVQPCPSEWGSCGPNPYYGFMLLTAKHCGSVDSELGVRNRDILRNMVSENPEAYAKLDSKPDFQQSQIEAEALFIKLGAEEQRKLCLLFIEK